MLIWNIMYTGSFQVLNSFVKMAAHRFADESSVVESSTPFSSKNENSSSSTSPVNARRGRGRGRASNHVSQRQRGRGRGARRERGRTWTATELAAAQTCRAQRSDNLSNMVHEMTADELRGLVLSIAERHSSIVLDMASNLSRGSVPRSDEPSPGAASWPSWCLCHRCQDMGRDQENVCCGMQPQYCTSERPEPTVQE